MTRQHRTPRERAEIALGIALRRRDKAVAAEKTAKDALTAATAERDEATRLHEYAQQHPALQTPSTNPATTEENTKP